MFSHSDGNTELGPASSSAPELLTPTGQRLSLEYFVGWGGPSVVQLARAALDFLGTDLRGRRVLEIGYGHGTMSCLFALLGARVHAVDTHDVTRAEASTEAAKWGVLDRIQFTRYSGDPREIQEADFDIAFTKSVLLLVSDLEGFLRGLGTRLRPGARLAFIENGFHHPLDVLARRLSHWWHNNQAADYPGIRMYNWRLPIYLSAARVAVFRRVFEVQGVLRAQSPHWRLIEAFNPAS